MRMGAASAIGATRQNENDVTMTIAGLWRYGDWRHVATGCTALVSVTLASANNASATTTATSHTLSEFCIRDAFKMPTTEPTTVFQRSL